MLEKAMYSIATLGNVGAGLGANTEVGGIEGLANKILGIILLVLVIVFGGRLIAMFQQRQYAQLIVVFLIAGFSFWFVTSPTGFMNFFSGIMDSIFTGNSGE